MFAIAESDVEDQPYGFIPSGKIITKDKPPVVFADHIPRLFLDDEKDDFTDELFVRWYDPTDESIKLQYEAGIKTSIPLSKYMPKEFTHLMTSTIPFKVTKEWKSRFVVCARSFIWVFKHRKLQCMRSIISDMHYDLFDFSKEYIVRLHDACYFVYQTYSNFAVCYMYDDADNGVIYEYPSYYEIIWYWSQCEFVVRDKNTDTTYLDSYGRLYKTSPEILSVRLYRTAYTIIDDRLVNVDLVRVRNMQLGPRLMSYDVMPIYR